MADKMLTPKFHVSFVNVFQPEKPMKGTAPDPNKKPTYAVTALFEKGTDLSELRKAAEAAVVKKWGADKAKWPAQLRSPFRDQGEKADKYEGYEAGAIFMKFKSYTRPGVVDEKVQDIIEEKDFYSGCYARASVTAWAYGDKNMNPGVSFWLSNIQKLADGKPLGGRTRPSDDFEAVVEDGDVTAPESIFG